jgi:hypothetical protein
MADVMAQSEASTQPLNELQRIADTFVAPSKTFSDILRSAAWWGPFLVLVLISFAFSWTVQTKVGWDVAFDNQVKMNPKAAQRMEQAQANLPPERLAAMRSAQIKGTEYTSYGRPLLVLLFTAITTLLVWPTINFGFGGRAKFSTIFAVFMYTALISDGLKYLLAIIALYAGVAPDSFLLPNPVGTNLGYYLVGGDSPYWLVVLGMFLDVFGIWALVLAVIGCSMVGKVKRGAAAAAVVGWWAVFAILMSGLAAM